VSTVDDFVARRSETWTELERLVQRAGTRPAKRLRGAEVRALGAAYRATAADLAVARRQFRGDALVTRLERLVRQARSAVYHAPRRSGTLRDFATHGYWRRVRERPALLAVAGVCLLGAGVLGGYWAWRDPGAAAAVVPGEFQYVTEPRVRGEDWGVAVDDQAGFASQIFTNNIQVAILALAGGMLFGVGAVVLLLYNGLVIGAVMGFGVGAGNGSAMFQQVVAHGVLELSCIVVAGAAGMRIGWAIVDPGSRARGAALREEARAATEMVLGTAAWLVVAGLVEGFVTPAGAALGLVVAVGAGLGALYWAFVLVWGRAPAAGGASGPPAARRATAALAP
jgi:uncharacterized membrane protein SpoIIM required for sporulation